MEPLIFADGASLGNPGPGGWGAIILTADNEVNEIGGAENRTTNNRMELMACIKALEVPDFVTGTICTDSTYVVSGITKWVHSWERNNWKTAEGQDVLNRDLWERLIKETKNKGPLIWRQIPGHSGIAGNERVDEIATSFAKGKPIKLYHGQLDRYVVDLQVVKVVRFEKPFYLSLVDGKLLKHESWGECEQRIKGRANAKFKKISNSGEKMQTLRSWGWNENDF